MNTHCRVYNLSFTQEELIKREFRTLLIFTMSSGKKFLKTPNVLPTHKYQRGLPFLGCLIKSGRFLKPQIQRSQWLRETEKII
jgi:hypothetical protein